MRIIMKTICARPPVSQTLSMLSRLLDFFPEVSIYSSAITQLKNHTEGITPLILSLNNYFFDQERLIHIFAILLQKMKSLRKYRTYSSVLLLALYAFILTPVQWWHKHPAKAAIETVQPAGGKFSHPGKELSGKCSICDHQYSICYSDAGEPPVVPLVVGTSSYRFSAAAPPEPMHFSCSNKGPPVNG
jgi:hypothetical protein